MFLERVTVPGEGYCSWIGLLFLDRVTVPGEGIVPARSTVRV